MDCISGMSLIDDGAIDLTVTSPPYDGLREYNGYAFDFEQTANQLYRITKDGGVVVWVVADQTKDFNESLTSFRQALYFQSIGFKMLDTMVYLKSNYAPIYPGLRRYANQFEYMFILVKGKRPKTFNPVQRPKVVYDKPKKATYRQPDGTLEKKIVQPNGKDTKDATNVWQYAVGNNKTGHPAVFPELLAQDHILSWSEPGDVVLDPFSGSGTTAKMSLLNNRDFIAFELSTEYCNIADERIKDLLTDGGGDDGVKE
jgi:site-specific DNA-methyltransferase (adenine-specific)